MKPGPIVAMVALIFLGMWLVLQPSLSRKSVHDPEASVLVVRTGATALRVEQREARQETSADGPGGFEYHFITPAELEALGWIPSAQFERVLAERSAAWEARPAFERALLGFFNISTWWNFAWIALGLGGQACFFGRMLIQWVVSENRRESVVPPLFWWLSFFGGVALFTYFVWRVDFVGVLGQSTGVVIYARNLRLIKKQKRRVARRAAEEAQAARAIERETAEDPGPQAVLSAEDIAESSSAGHRGDGAS